MVGDYLVWQAMLDELLLFPQAEHDDLFDGLQTMMEGALKFGSWGGGEAVIRKSMMPDEFFEDFEERRYDFDEFSGDYR